METQYITLWAKTVSKITFHPLLTLFQTALHSLVSLTNIPP